MHSRIAQGLLALAAFAASASTAAAQSASPFSLDSAIGISHFVGEDAEERPDIVVDITATVRLGKGWAAYVRPWFRKASSDPYALATEIYQAAVQHERSGRVSTRVDLGYILSPIGLGMMDMRPDTSPTITPHLSYLIPMPSFDPGAPASLPIASSYPLGGQVTVSTTKWDARAALVTSPPNREFVLHAESPNPSAHPTVIVGGGVTPRTGLRVGVAYAAGEYATGSEMTRLQSSGRSLQMMSVEGEFAFRYTKLTAEFTRDSIETATGHTVASAWFVQGVQSLAPRWFVAARQEGANAPPQSAGSAAPTLGVTDVTVGFRLSEGFTLRTAFTSRKTYFTKASSQQVGASLVWARRWW